MKTDWEAIQQDLMLIIEEVKLSHSKTTSELSTLTSLVEKTFDLVVELRFKDGIETIDASFVAFLKQTDLTDLQYYSMELQTTAEKYFDPKKVGELLFVFCFYSILTESQRVHATDFHQIRSGSL